MSWAVGGTSGDLEVSTFWVAVLTMALATIVSVSALGLSVADADLRHQGILRDVVRERETAVNALSGAPMESDHLRPPGAVVLLLPVLLFPEDRLTWSAAAVGIVAVAALVIGSVRLAGGRSVVLGVGVPTSVAFTQGVVHGSMFVVIAASLTWAWVSLTRKKESLAGILVGVAGAARLWPLLLVAPLVLTRFWRPVIWAGATFALLSAIGLALPGVSWASTLESFDSSFERWVSATHNGSLAGWLGPFGEWAGPIGLAVGIAVWAIGLMRIRTLNARLAWSLPAAVLASPLAWMPYLLSFAPIVAVYGNRLMTRAIWLVVYGLLLFGYLWIPNKVVTTLVIVAAMWVVWVEGDEPFSAHDRGEGGSRLDQAE